METTNYITSGTGYIALLAAIVEQARHDAKGKNKADAEDALAGIKEWRNEVMENLNFKIYEWFKRKDTEQVFFLFIYIVI